MTLSREEALRVALEKIADPIKFMRQEAEEQGAKLNGQMAVLLADDANYLKEIARTALRELGTEPSQPCHCESPIDANDPGFVCPPCQAGMSPTYGEGEKL